MTRVGSVAGIHRYPVKSMLGEELDAARIGEAGIPGDRAWGLRDEQRGDFFVGKRAGALMRCRARTVEGAAPEIELPDGQVLRADDRDAAGRIGQAIGREVTIWPVVPEARQAAPKDGLRVQDEARALLGRDEDEPLPDFSQLPPEVFSFMARGGAFFDALPLLLLSRRSLESLASAAPASRIDARRFRPNLLLDVTAPGDYPEQAWIGRRVGVGSALLSITMSCTRCVMTTHAFEDLPEDPKIMRTLVKETGGNLGVYALVETPGEVRRGDAVTLLD